MELIATLTLLIFLTWNYFRYRSKKGLMFYQSDDREVSDGCRGYILAVGVVLFLIISLIYQKELLQAVGNKFIE